MAAIESKERRLNGLKLTKIGRAVISKLTPPAVIQRGMAHKPGEIKTPDRAFLDNISKITGANVNDSMDVFEILPDIKQASQVYCSAVLSPKDMMSTEMNYRVAATVETNDMIGSMLKVVADFFRDEYQLHEKLGDILEDALFKKGSYPLLVIPEASIDAIINDPINISTESMASIINPDKKSVRSLGILGPAKLEQRTSLPSMEAMFDFGIEANVDIDPIIKSKNKKGEPVDVLGISVTDNIQLLKLPMFRGAKTRASLEHRLGINRLGLEEQASKKTHLDAVREKNAAMQEVDQLHKQLYNNRQYISTPILPILTSTQTARPNIGHPLVMTLPPECVIPVHVPSNPDEHIGYYILLDEFGNPVIKSKAADYFNQLENSFTPERQRGAGSSTTSSQIEQVRDSLLGNIDPSAMNTASLYNSYVSIVEADLLNRLHNGVYGDSVEIGKPDEVYRIMFGRSLAAMRTQVLYVPVELMTYVAFDYNNNGIGKSLLEETRIIASIRSILMFANTMASIKNSVGRVAMNVELDPEDPDPSKTVEFLFHEYMRTRSIGYPLGAANPLDTIEFLQNAGVELLVSGHPGYPTTTLSTEEKTSNHAKVDQEFDEEMRRRHIMGFGLAPETIDSSMSIEFAQQIISSNLILAKQAKKIQNKLMGFIRKFIRTYTLNSQILIDELKKVIDDKKSTLNPEKDKEFMEKIKSPEAFIREFIGALETTLPEPDGTKLENQSASYQAYAAFIDAVLPAYISEEMMQGLMQGDANPGIPVTISAIKSALLRDYIRRNNILPELDALFSLGDTNNPVTPLMDTHMNHLQGIARYASGFMEKFAAIDAVATLRVDAIKQGAEEKWGAAGGMAADNTPSEDPSAGAEEGGSMDFPDDFSDFTEDDKSAESGVGGGEQGSAEPEAAPEA